MAGVVLYSLIKGLFSVYILDRELYLSKAILPTPLWREVKWLSCLPVLGYISHPTP